MNFSKIPHWACVLVISLAAFALHYLYLLEVSGGDLDLTRYPDERNYYINGAKEFLTQGWSYFVSERALWNGPLNILWVAIFGVCVACVKLANILLVVGAGVALWDLLRRLASLKAAYGGLVLYLLQPTLLHFSGTLLSEPPFIALLVLSAWAYARGGQHRNWRWALLSGVFLGLASLVRPTTQLFPFFLIGWELLRTFIFERRLSIRREVLVFFIGAFVVLGPYVVKNYMLHSKVGVANGSGAVLFLGNDLRTDGHEPVYSQFDFDTIEITYPYAHLDTEGDRRLTQAALREIAEHPDKIAILTLRKFFRYIFGSPQAYFYPFQSLGTYWKHSSGMEKVKSVLSVVWVSFCMAALVFGLCRAASVGGISSFLTAMLAYLSLLHAFLFPIARLALPFHVLSIPIVVIGFLTRPVLALLLGSTIFVGMSFIDADRYVHEVGQDYASYFSTQTKLLPSMLKESAGIEINSMGRLAVVEPSAYAVYEITPNEVKINQALFVGVKSANAVKADKFKLTVLVGSESEEFSKGYGREVMIRVSPETKYYRMPLALPKSLSGQALAVKIIFPPRAVKAAVELDGIQWLY